MGWMFIQGIPVMTARSGGPPPIFVSATIAQATPTIITVVFDSALASYTATNEITIAGKTISTVTASGTALTVTVSVAFAYGDAPTVVYTAGTLKGATGGSVATFSESVTNNIIYAPDIDDGGTKFLYISSVISATKGITKDGSNLVSKWADYLESGRDLLQATGANQPLWSSNGVLSDGIDNFMATLAFTWDQPEFIYIVFRQVTWTNTDHIWDGISAQRMIFEQFTATPNLIIYAPSSGVQNAGLAVNTWGIVRALYNSTSSKLIVNNNAPATGDVGLHNSGGITLGASYFPGNYSNIEVKEIIGRSSTAGEAAIYAYLSAKYGI